MTIENASVAHELAKLAQQRAEGEAAGYADNVNHMPDFFNKPYKMLTQYQRSYIFGRELRLMELAEKGGKG